jgi:hypothetical protein
MIDNKAMITKTKRQQTHSDSDLYLDNSIYFSLLKYSILQIDYTHTKENDR